MINNALINGAKSFKSFLTSIGSMEKGGEAETEEFNLHLSYSSVPLTLTLQKRQFEEEQLKKYGIAKQKTCEIKE